MTNTIADGYMKGCGNKYICVKENKHNWKCLCPECSKKEGK